MKSAHKKRTVIHIILALVALFSLSAPGPLSAQTGRERLIAGYAAMDPTVLPLWLGEHPEALRAAES